MFHNMIKPIAICLIVLQITIQIIQIDASYYDPESQDGIPLMSSRSLAPEIKWRYDAHDADLDSHRISPAAATQRRSSTDADLDDGLEEEDDDDKDEYQSGSSNHDSYENPAFGESRRAAKDGDDIESFFDKHLGPQDVSEGGSRDDHEVPINEMPARADFDDHYEAAASSPLSTIFQALVNAHKRPLVITTTGDDSTPASNDNNSQQQQQTTSSSSPVGISALRAGAQTGAYPIDGATPIAYFTPMMAAPSSLASYEPMSGGSQDQTEDYGPVREIYISRRPSALLAPTSLYAPSSQSSNANWRSISNTAAARPYPDEQSGSDYSRYPVAASHAYQQEQQQAQQPEDENTVTYGLSFGSSNADEAPETPAQQALDDQTSVDEPVYAPQYNMRNHPMRHTSSTRSYNTNYNPLYTPTMAMSPGAYTRSQTIGMVQQQQQQLQQQAPYHGARYHKDPTEGSIGAQPINYGHQYRTPGGTASSVAPKIRDNREREEWAATRQQLLASLNKQIRVNPYYRQNAAVAATTPASRYGSQQQPGKRYVLAKKRGSDNDLDTYSSFHSEIDPYRSLTTQSQIVSEPIRDSTFQSGSNRVPSNIDINAEPSGANNNNTSNQAGTSSSNTDQSQEAAQNLVTGPVTNVADSSQQSSTTNGIRVGGANLRVRRDDSDDRESDDADDDGVWVDDDEDDDNRQQSSDLNETSQEPEEEDNQQQHIRNVNQPGIIGGPHSYELSPNDLMVYQG